jgi:C-terminal processing protease CtpA/Prc
MRLFRWLLFINLCILINNNLFAQHSDKSIPIKLTIPPIDYLWPIPNKNIGENILYQPNDLIGDELNVDNLFISAPEGSNILAPQTGIVKHISYTYIRNLHGSNSFRDSLNSATNVDEYDLKFRKKIAKENPGIEADFVSISMTISVGKNDRYFIQGIRPVKKFKTGDIIQAGDIIGKVGYCYRLVPESGISFSRSFNDTIADPMSVFGLKSTFIPYPKNKINRETHKNSVNELKDDFKIFRQSLEEGHPGLYDYTSLDMMNAMFNDAFQKIIQPMTSSQFYQLLHPIIDSIRDSHTELKTTWKSSSSNKDFSVTPVKFALINDSLVIYQTFNDYKHLIGARIIAVNGIAVDSLRKLVKPFVKNHYDGYIDGQTNSYLFSNFSALYKKVLKKKEGDKITIQFANGSKQDFIYEKRKSNDRFLPISKPSTCIIEKCNTQILNNQTALLEIKTFDLLETQEDAIADFIKTISVQSIQHLIIDLRDNRGGSSSTLTKLYSYIANEPFKICTSSMVNNNDTYSFFKYCFNYGTDSRAIFKDYIKDESRSVFFLPESKIPTIQPNDSIHFKGKVYVLTNEFSQSSATVFAGLVHKYKRGLIIGRETGSSYQQLNASKYAIVNLKNSALILKIPLIKEVFCERDKSDIPWGRGVIPDYFIDFSTDDLLQNGQDKIKDYTIEMIKKTRGNKDS